MNSLEFIEKEIDALNHQIEYIKSNMKKYVDFRTDGQFYIDEIQLKLNFLHQIKTELEAWEEIKKYLILDEEYSPFYKTTYNFLTLKNDCIDASNSYEEGESLTIIKKTLEVKDVD